MTISQNDLDWDDEDELDPWWEDGDDWDDEFDDDLDDDLDDDFEDDDFEDDDFEDDEDDRWPMEVLV